MSRDPRDWQADMKIIQAYKSSEDYNPKYEKTFMGAPVVVVLEHYVQQVKQLKEDNARWACKHTAAEQNYQTQSNVIAELRGRAEKAEHKYKAAKQSFEDEQRWSAENITRAVKAEEREQKLKGELEDTKWYLSEGLLTTEECCEVIDNFLTFLYPLDREDTNDN